MHVYLRLRKSGILQQLEHILQDHAVHGRQLKPEVPRHIPFREEHELPVQEGPVVRRQEAATGGPLP